MQADPNLGLIGATNTVGPWAVPPDAYSEETYDALATC